MENDYYYEPKIKTARNKNYYKVDYANEVTKLNVEKQQLITWLEDKIKELEEKIKGLNYNEIEYYDAVRIDIYQEVLDFVRGDKE